MINDLKSFEVKEPVPLTPSQYHKIPYTSKKRLLQVTTTNRSILHIQGDPFESVTFEVACVQSV